MAALVIITVTLVVLYVLFLLPQRRQMQAHQALVASLEEGDEVVMSAGIYGRITSLGPEDLRLEVAPGVELHVARQAVLRRVEHAGAPPDVDDEPADEAADPPQVDSGEQDGNNAELAEDVGDGHAPGAS
jgi:preprotein translocase subunit YajC